ncbi:uncharacterized protein RAG0_15575 [Rhynchosporium agropyri]|uniref:Uncharacterized protein n=1 Tax=Rhynchosporium agropyri TaxID=914238 RepID=A0A1E1LNM7_9HELO|nr:uncharacterized protein RAG0_15575 [Rhynchosporium agropyri]
MSKYVRQEKSQRKHPVASSASSLIKAPAVPEAPRERPGFKGPGFLKKTVKQARQPQQSKASRVDPAYQEQLIPNADQQLLLNILRTTFPVCLDYETLKPILQGIRVALSEGNSEKAFSRLDWMQAYAVRWSSTRALCCATILLSIADELSEETHIHDFLTGTCADDSLWRIVCFGGGPTEVLAFAAALRHNQPLGNEQLPDKMPLATEDPSVASVSPSPTVNLYLVDKANWAPVVSNLELELVTPPVLSKYASQSAHNNNLPFLHSSTLRTAFIRKDILTASQEELTSIIGPAPSLITFFFTLHNLYNTSSARAAALILKTTLLAPKDSLLLIVDLAEPASETAVGTDGAGVEKGRFRMGTWLDLVLSGQLGPEDIAQKSPWKELIKDEYRVFKLAEGLKFPVSLDHVTFQVYLFKKG